LVLQAGIILFQTVMNNTMNRRHILTTAIAGAVSLLLPKNGSAKDKDMVQELPPLLLNDEGKPIRKLEDRMKQRELIKNRWLTYRLSMAKKAAHMLKLYGRFTNYTGKQRTGLSCSIMEPATMYTRLQGKEPMTR
jgi:hypothetical protein